MRMSTADVDALREVISELDTDSTRDAYRAGTFPNADQVKDLDKRYRWDLYYAAKAWRGMSDHNYTQAHIDTALRQIVAPL
jgi:hypothetical protein